MFCVANLAGNSMSGAGVKPHRLGEGIRAACPGCAVGSRRISLLESRACRAASAGVNAVKVDARECIVTDAAHTRATPLWDETNNRLQAVLVPLLKAGETPVMGGFVGATRDGIPTTLGRGDPTSALPSLAPAYMPVASRSGRM